jgi:hypothetical protein
MNLCGGREREKIEQRCVCVFIVHIEILWQTVIIGGQFRISNTVMISIYFTCHRNQTCINNNRIILVIHMPPYVHANPHD